MLPIFKGEWAVPYRASAKLEWCLTLGGRAEVEDVAEKRISQSTTLGHRFRQEQGLTLF